MPLSNQEVQSIRRMIGDAVAQQVEKYDVEKVDNVRRDFYTYEAQAIGLAAGASANDIINIEADSDFIMQKLAYECDIAGALYTESSRPIPNIAVQLIDSGSGRQLMQQPIPIPSIFGTGQLPFILPNPRKFLKNSTIQVAFTSFEAAQAYTVRLAFIGYKIYGTK